MDDERRLSRFFARLHADDAPPPFERVWGAAAERARPRPRRLVAATALAAILLAAAALVLLWPAARGGDPAADVQAAALAAELSAWSSPLDFLGEVPGGELFGSRPLPAGEADELLRMLEAPNQPGETL